MPEDQSTPATDARVLDNPAWSALTGPHAEIAQRVGRAARYPAELSPFAALVEEPDEAAWRDAAALAGSDDMVLVAPQSDPPMAWTVRGRVAGIQMLAYDLDGEPDPEAVALGTKDVPEMLGLIDRTRPGPFLPRTVEFGGYLGIRRNGVLVAMAGERLRLPGWTEVSAVCTDETARGSGLAGRLVRAVVAGIRTRGDRALLHVAVTNRNAIGLYRSLGFVERREIDFVMVSGPNPPT